MAFVIPTFPITCDIFTASSPPPAGPARLTDVPCQLRAPSASYIGLLQPSSSQAPCMCILLAAGTDIRDPYCLPINSSDWAEVPSGSGRFYRVHVVDDIAKGFPNEHRFAVLFKTLGVPWPTPIP